MNSSTWTDSDTANAKEVWKEFQKAHDITDRLGQTVGIDPITRRVWFGKDAREAVHAARADGINNVLLCIRVGKDYYVRKGGRR
ncbi:MAG: hypothetical protein ACJ8FY_25805 [Gemmataceae bacterium]